jgi:hypothetical protein
MAAVGSLKTTLKLLLLLIVTLSCGVVGADSVFADNQGVAVQIPDDGAWTASLVGFDARKIRSVTYYVRDAREHWRRLGPFTHSPFQAQLNWWEWDNSAHVAVTAHAVISGAGWFGSDAEVTDPGGWHWINGPRATSPSGSLEVRFNGDGSLEASYRPRKQLSMLKGVQFGLRKNGNWTVAGTVDQMIDGAFHMPVLPGTEIPGWPAKDSQVSVTALWPNVRQLRDPVPPVSSDHFVQTPLAPLQETLKSSEAVSGDLSIGINPHAISDTDPGGSLKAPTWTRCSSWQGGGLTSNNSFEADIVGAIGDKQYALAIRNDDFSAHPIPGTYTMDGTGSSPINVDFWAIDGSTHWGDQRQSVAVVTFADHFSGSINARLGDGTSSYVTMAGTWRCAGSGTVSVAVSPLPSTAVAPTPAPPTAPPAVAPPAAAPPQQAPPPPPTAAPAGCHPLTNTGKCYEPGEFCRNSDHGATGRAGDGEAIICRNNNGWRWEPA